MRRKKAELLGDILQRYLRQEGLETPLNEYRLMESWKEVVGATISKYTQNLFIRNQILYVSLTSSALRQNLIMNRSMLVNSLNVKVGAQVIVDIAFL